MNAGREIGYCCLSPEIQERFSPVNAGWKAGNVPFESFFGPTMDLSSTASRLDNSISWLVAIGNDAALSVFDAFGADTIFQRNIQLADHLRSALSEVGREPIDFPVANHSTIASVPLGDTEPIGLLATLEQRNIICSAGDGNLRLAVHFYNHEDDITQVASVLIDL